MNENKAKTVIGWVFGIACYSCSLFVLFDDWRGFGPMLTEFSKYGVSVLAFGFGLWTLVQIAEAIEGYICSPENPKRRGRLMIPFLAFLFLMTEIMGVRWWASSII